MNGFSNRHRLKFAGNFFQVFDSVKVKVGDDVCFGRSVDI